MCHSSRTFGLPGRCDRTPPFSGPISETQSVVYEVDRCDGSVGYTLYFRRILRVVLRNVENGNRSVRCGGKVARLHSSEEMRALIGRARTGEFRMAIDGRSIDEVEDIEFMDFVYRGDGYGYWGYWTPKLP